MPDTQTVVVLGGGIGGVVAARRLRALAPPQTRVVLVERSLRQSYPPSYTWVMTGERRPDAITRDLARLRRKGIEVVEAAVDAIDVDARTVSAGGAEIAYDHLVVALGAELAPEAVPGLAGEAFTYYQADEADRLHRALDGFTGGRVALVISSLPYKCPAAPYEGAMLLESLFRRRGIRARVEISLSTPEPQPLPVAGPALGAAVTAMLERKGIAYHTKRKTVEVDAAAHEVVFEDGAREPYDLLVAVPPHRPPAVVRASTIAGDTGWAKVDARTLATAKEHVYAIGDVTAIPLFDGLPLPKAGVFAHHEAEVVAGNIAADLRGTTGGRGFDGHGFCFLETGDGRAASARGDFYASPRDIHMQKPSRLWRLGKAAFERWWLYRWY